MIEGNSYLNNKAVVAFTVVTALVKEVCTR